MDVFIVAVTVSTSVEKRSVRIFVEIPVLGSVQESVIAHIVSGFNVCTLVK